jgi:hypothetical protein
LKNFDCLSSTLDLGKGITRPIFSQTRSPGSASSSGLGTPWSTPTNVLTSNDVRTSSSVSSSSTPTLQTLSYGFSIPDWAKLLGFELSVERQDSLNGGGVRDLSVFLRKLAGIVGVNKATAVIWTGADTVATYGGPTDLWGATWSPADVNNGGFGSALTAQEIGVAPGTPAIDHIAITVYYR